MTPTPVFSSAAEAADLARAWLIHQTRFHHCIVIHQWGWTVVLNPDGTTTAYSPDKTKILHSHGPPPGPSG
jgi:hypothetical protein